jgi:hypothetical protein
MFGLAGSRLFKLKVLNYSEVVKSFLSIGPPQETSLVHIK